VVAFPRAALADSLCPGLSYRRPLACQLTGIHISEVKRCGQKQACERRFRRPIQCLIHEEYDPHQETLESAALAPRTPKRKARFDDPD